MSAVGATEVSERTPGNVKPVGRCRAIYFYGLEERDVCCNMDMGKPLKNLDIHIGFWKLTKM